MVAYIAKICDTKKLNQSTSLYTGQCLTERDLAADNFVTWALLMEISIPDIRHIRK